MATQTIENFNTLDLETLASVEGGLSCDEGMLAVGGLGAVGGPWRACRWGVSRCSLILFLICMGGIYE